MEGKYLTGAILANAYRLLRVFPNSDPIMGFVLPAAKNEPFWKAPLFAFATMFTFDMLTSGIGAWTWVTSTTYALIAFAFTMLLKAEKPGLATYTKYGLAGVLAFDFITGPAMGSALFHQPFWLTLLAQIPFTAMHLVSVSFSILIITPFFDRQAMLDLQGMASSVRNAFLQAVKAWGAQ
ncbi:MAG: hypothetical protein HY544_02340 [Candidatus Diapherotrites archaeon]|uniref:Uncharacterized protein n=1 Tax=Candidatus Iainarchaeum sp. TaxID=3101447 RepID=A0A8T3YJ90_9ARCH|nr:hypothetical protein [Candidatus Diapherotrites archaeon]